MDKIILWVDDLRQPPEGPYYWAKSVNQAIAAIRCVKFDYLDLDHDAGDYAYDGGDYIRLLDWMEKNEISYPIRIHSMNPVGRMNMLAIAEHNGWRIIR